MASTISQLNESSPQVFTNSLENKSLSFSDAIVNTDNKLNPTTYEMDYYNNQIFEEDLNSSIKYGQQIFTYSTQDDANENVTDNSYTSFSIPQNYSKNNRKIRSHLVFDTNKSNPFQNSSNPLQNSSNPSQNSLNLSQKTSNSFQNSSNPFPNSLNLLQNSSNQFSSLHKIKSENRVISHDIVDSDTAHDRTREDLTTADLYWDFPQNFSTDFNNSGCTSKTNCTDIKHAPTFRDLTMIKCIVLLGLGSAAVFGNVATLASIIRRGRQKTSTVYLLLLHLSVADLMVTWFCIIGEGLWMLAVQWYAGNAFCKFFKFLQMLALYLSTFILVVIGLDRLCAVRFPMRRIKARRQVQKYVLVAWVLSCGLSAPQAVIFRVARGPFVEEFYQCVTYGFYTAPWQEQLYTSVSLLCMFLIPLCVLVATYAATFATIASRNRVFGGDRNPFIDARCKILRKAKVKSLWITVVIVSTFIVCWTPYYVSMIISVFLKDQVGQGLHEVIFFFGSSTAVLNPVIYGAFHLRKGRPVPASNRTTSSRAETTWAMSTLRRFRLTATNGKANGSSSLNLGASTQRRNTRRTHLEVF